MQFFDRFGKIWLRLRALCSYMITYEIIHLFPHSADWF